MIEKKLKSIIATILIIGFSSQNLPILFAKTLTINKHSPTTISKDKNNSKKTTGKGKKTTKSISKTKPGSVKAKYQNGTLNDQIQISEIFPNPKGKDANNEWIELYNPTNESTNLGNWQIIQHATKSRSEPNGEQNERSEIQSDTAKISKAKKLLLPDILNIPPKSYLILSNNNLKFTLKNQNNLVELKNFNNETIDEIEYEKSSENLSFAKITIKKEKKSKIIKQWVKPSKNSKNPIYYEIQGQISKKNQGSSTENINSFQILSKNNQILEIHQEKSNNSPPLNNLFQQDVQIITLVEKIDDKNYRLIDFEIKNSTSNKTTTGKNTQNENWLYFSLIPIGLLVFLLKKTFRRHGVVNNLGNIGSG